MSRATRPSFARAGFRRLAPGRYLHESGLVEIEYLAREDVGDEVLPPAWQIVRIEDGAVIDHDGLYPRLTDALLAPVVKSWADAPSSDTCPIHGEGCEAWT